MPDVLTRYWVSLKYELVDERAVERIVVRWRENDIKARSNVRSVEALVKPKCRTKSPA